MAFGLRQWTTIIGLVILCYALRTSTVLGIQCVVCDSYTNGALCEPWDHFTFITDCSQYPGVNLSKPVGCRKIDQKVNNRRRVIRQCSNVADKEGCIDRVGTNSVWVHYCFCTEDLCNKGPIKPSGYFLLKLLVCAFVYRFVYTFH